MIYREGVCCIGFTPDKKTTVLIERPDFSVWWVPGGEIEDDEIWEPEKAAKREFKEETGLDIEIGTYHGMYDIKIPSFSPSPVLHDRQYVYSGTIVGGELTINKEAKKVEYFQIDKLPRGLLYAFKSRIYDASNGIVHKSPIIQTLKLSDIINNLQVMKKLPALFKKLTVNSPKKSS